MGLIKRRALREKVWQISGSGKKYALRLPLDTKMQNVFPFGGKMLAHQQTPHLWRRCPPDTVALAYGDT